MVEWRKGRLVVVRVGMVEGRRSACNSGRWVLLHLLLVDGHLGVALAGFQLEGLELPIARLELSAQVQDPRRLRLHSTLHSSRRRTPLRGRFRHLYTMEE